jgi:hypothetical protein
MVTITGDSLKVQRVREEENRLEPVGPASELRLNAPLSLRQLAEEFVSETAAEASWSWIADSTIVDIDPDNEVKMSDATFEKFAEWVREKKKYTDPAKPQASGKGPEARG